MKSEDILTIPPPPADQRISYGGDPNQFIDVRLAKKSKYGCAVFIHGGFWRAKYDLAYGGHLCHALSQAGWTSFNVEYRRVGNPGGGWPATFSDLRSALAVILSQKKWRVSAEQLVVLGHSAGGQLALALAAHDHRIKHVVSLAGVLNLKRAYELHLSNDAVVEFLGGTPAQVPDHYAEASPAELRISARQLLVHGKKDDIVPFSITAEYVRLKRPTERIELLALEDAGHFEVVDPRSGVWKRIAEASTKLLTRS